MYICIYMYIFGFSRVALGRFLWARYPCMRQNLLSLSLLLFLSCSIFCRLRFRHLHLGGQAP